ncbi:membrane protein insertion efficiency factor YidD [Helicobacter sp. faydin-H20]|uniref:membrane protein insertion efficiency factor YidD n=1 Tax=Helicobacter anatolicus TaxID=2905874 RepID=UPI001E4920CC|nr:membrane protein insertion efficiency factor YidD [Helicobacter anatolicus]MCE3036819.1 membrane protein insertion efficiency factor YidD [Helicobacter anatolicus]
MHIGVWFIQQYQKFISFLMPNSCRFYPTCSEFAIWALKNQSFYQAIFQIFFRILKCNQFFRGGVDYPIKKALIVPNFFGPCKIVFWYIPIQNHHNKFFIIKSFKEAS